MKTLLLSISMIMSCIFTTSADVSNDSIYPGKIWPDDRGEHINAHGGGMLYKDGTYYWYGEHKAESSNNALVGVTCYSSKDLINWKYQGVALSVSDDEKSDIVKGSIIERPKVVFNKKSGKYVMWFHLELKDKGYSAARAGMAISDTPQGPFKFISSSRINAGKLPYDMDGKKRAILDTLNLDNYKKWWTPEWQDAIKKGLFLKRDIQSGQMSRDMTIFIDDDEKAYHIYSSEDNLTLQIAELSDDYQRHTGKYIRMIPAGNNEAPAIFKKDGKYWMITSGCTGWAPNEARMFSADNIFGPWTQHPNPCVGNDSEKTFGAQSTFIFKVEGKRDLYIFMADVWRPKNPIDGRYMWLPIEFSNGKPILQWRDSWSLSSYK